MWRGQLHRIFTKAIHEGDLTACKHQVMSLWGVIKRQLPEE